MLLTFREAVELANRVGIRDEQTNGLDTVILTLADGSELHFKSEYDGPYSSDTPGNGIELPSVFLKTR